MLQLLLQLTGARCLPTAEAQYFAALTPNDMHAQPLLQCPRGWKGQRACRHGTGHGKDEGGRKMIRPQEKFLRETRKATAMCMDVAARVGCEGLTG